MSRRCMGCMREYDEKFDICPHCGYQFGAAPDREYCLEPGSILVNRYIAGRVIAMNNRFVVYIGWDYETGHEVAIREYLPHACVTRERGEQEIRVYAGKEAMFGEGLAAVASEAKQRAGAKGQGKEQQGRPRLADASGQPAVWDYFEENGTGYVILAYGKGFDKAAYLGAETGPKTGGQTAAETSRAAEDAPVQTSGKTGGVPKWAFAVAGAAVLCVIMLILAIVRSGSSGGTEAETEIAAETAKTVPNLVGLTLEKAEASLAETGLEVTVEEEVFSKEVAEGLILSQDPEAGAEAESGMTVSVRISKGEERAAVPAVVGVDAEEAETLLREAGFANVSREDSEDEGVLNTVLEINVDEGSEVAIETEIVLSVCVKEPKIYMISVESLTQEDATAQIEALGLTVGEVTRQYSSSVTANCVISQSILAETEVIEGDVVDLVVSRGPRPQTASQQPATQPSPTEAPTQEVETVISGGGSPVIIAGTKPAETTAMYYEDHQND